VGRILSGGRDADGIEVEVIGMAKQMAKPLEFADVSHRIGRQKCRTNTLQVEGHPLDQRVVVAAGLFEMVLERLAEPLKGLLQNVVDAVDLEGCGGLPAVGRLGQTVLENAHRSAHGSAVLFPAILQDLKSYAIHRSPLPSITGFRRVRSMRQTSTSRPTSAESRLCRYSRVIPAGSDSSATSTSDQS
jgi:hypothetical protein